MKIGQFKQLMGAGAGASLATAHRQPMAFNDGQGFARSVYDAPQSALGFVVENSSYIEREVNRVMYPDIQYPALIPTDTSAPEWTPSVTYYSTDQVGAAKWVSGFASDLPNADITREKHKQAIHMAAIGYGYSLEEIGQAQLLGIPLASEKALAARRAYEEFIDKIAFQGDAAVNFDGFIDHAGVTGSALVAQNAGATSRLWSAKTADEILIDLNEPLSDTHSVSGTVELADTVLLGVTRYNYIATKPRSANSDTTILEYYLRNNTYTSQTGRPLTVRTLRGLEAAGAGATNRMITYRRSPDVLKLHIPMTHRFLQAQQKGALYIEVPGIFRIGGLEIRRPGAVRYRDGF